MNYPELLAAVIVETNRDDLTDETAQAVLSSTQKMHGFDFFKKDLVSAFITFDVTQFLQFIDTSQIPLFRKIKYIRKWDPTYAASEQDPTLFLPPLTNNSLGVPVNPALALRFFKFIDADDIFDREYKSAEKVDVAYEAGNVIFMKSSTALSQAIAMWYAWPNLDNSNNGANFNSWVAAKYPYTIVYDAASNILQKIGMTDAARKYDNPDPNNPGLVQSQIQLMLRTEIPLEGS